MRIAAKFGGKQIKNADLSVTLWSSGNEAEGMELGSAAACGHCLV